MTYQARTGSLLDFVATLSRHMFQGTQAPHRSEGSTSRTDRQSQTTLTPIPPHLQTQWAQLRGPHIWHPFWVQESEPRTRHDPSEPYHPYRPYLTDASASRIFDNVLLRCHHGIFGESVALDKPAALLLIHKPTWQEKGKYRSKKQSGLRRNLGTDEGYDEAARTSSWGRATSSTDAHWEKRGVNRQRSPPVGADPNLASRKKFHSTATTQTSSQQQCRTCKIYAAFTYVRHCGCVLCNVCYHAKACTCHTWRTAK